MTKVRMWALVADAGRARIFERERLGAEFVELDELARTADLPPSRDIISERPGRTHDSVGPGRHAMQARRDPHRELKRQSARDVAELLLDGVRNDAFDQLIVVAPPVYLGDLRAELAHEVTSRLLAEFPKDLTKIPAQELSQRLNELVAESRP